ncbi:MAG TPA: glycine cleavage system aminomethyltransferase GcvT, partial [Pirellulaceae bacterium]
MKAHMDNTLRKTPLHDWHAAHGARLVDFAGWAMPVQYGSIVAEHEATRRTMALFDVSHMGRFYFQGDQSGAFLDSIVTRRVIDLKEGQIRYGLVCNEQGGVLDDVLVYRLRDLQGETFHVMVVNAGNRDKIWNWLLPYLDQQTKVRVEDRTAETAMIAVQGPRAVDAMTPLLGFPLEDVPYYFGRVGTVASRKAIISRTGYTGEDGCELIVAAEDAVAVWEACLEAAGDSPAAPAGLGARDTLRLEAGMPLYGHELTESIH